MADTNQTEDAFKTTKSQDSRLKMLLAFIKLWFTEARVRGYARHAGSWLATWLVAQNLIPGDAGTAALVVGCVVNITIIIWSWNSSVKVTLNDKLAGLARHALTIGLGILVFKGYITGDTAGIVVEAVVGLIVSCGISAVAGEKVVPKPEVVVEAPTDGP
jgi:hypothetical protein